MRIFPCLSGALLIGEQRLAEAQARIQVLERALDTGLTPTPLSQTKISTPGLKGISSTLPQCQQASSARLETNYIPDTRSLDAALASPQAHLAWCGLGNRLSTARANFCATVYQQCGHVFDLDEFLVEAAASFEKEGFTSKKKTTVMKWPSPSPTLVKRCVESYAQCGLYSMFPFADPEGLQVLVNADVLNHPDTTRAANRACLAAFTANITQMHRHDPAFCDSDPDAYAQAALSLAPRILMEAPDLRTLEAIMMLVSRPLGSTMMRELSFLPSAGGLHCPPWPARVHSHHLPKSQHPRSICPHGCPHIVAIPHHSLHCAELRPRYQNLG